jgi:hypothetical protein
MVSKILVVVNVVKVPLEEFKPGGLQRDVVYLG